MKRGLGEMIEDVVRRVSGARDLGLGMRDSVKGQAPSIDDEITIGRVLSAIEDGVFSDADLALLRKSWANPRSSESPIPNPQSRSTPPGVGLPGTGGDGKSTRTYDLRHCLLSCLRHIRIAVLSIDPPRRRTGGALLGERPPLHPRRRPPD